MVAALAPAPAPDPAVRCTADPSGRASRSRATFPTSAGVIAAAAAEVTTRHRLLRSPALAREPVRRRRGQSGRRPRHRPVHPGIRPSRRGLADPFNPAEALHASARYLADLTRAYGNIGLAAVAYNGGEARAERFIARAGGLAAETRAYVQSITGHSAETWRDGPPASVDLALAGEGGFETTCIALAADRGRFASSRASRHSCPGG